VPRAERHFFWSGSARRTYWEVGLGVRGDAFVRIKYYTLTGNTPQMYDVKGNRVRIGRNPDNDIVLDSPVVEPEQALLHVVKGAWEVVALGRVNGIQVGDRRLRPGQSMPVRNGLVLQVFPFNLTVEMPDGFVATADLARQALERQAGELIAAVHLKLLKRMDLETRAGDSRQDSDEYLTTLERNLDELARLEGVFDPARAELCRHIAGSAVRRETIEGLVARAGAASAWNVAAPWARLLTGVPDREKELQRLIANTEAVLGLVTLTDLSDQIRRVEQGFWNAWGKKPLDPHAQFEHYLVGRFLKKEIKDIVFGYGPLESLLRIPTITEIMVVDRDRIFIEKNGVLENSGRRFLSDEMTVAIIERIVARVGRRIDKSSPLVDARLTDGSRVNAVIPPLAVSGPCLTVRKFPARKMLVDDLLAKKSLTPAAARFLRACVLGRKNILISGGTGSGKTTLLNCLSDFIPDKERIVTIEDTAELQLHKEHVVRMETKPANVEGAGAYTIRDLVKNALRMRPDRIVVGECRGAEALDMLQAMNSGHDGSLTTLHANSAADVVLRLEVLVQMAADLPVDSIHRQIASAVDIIVQLHRLRNGRRCVTQITEFVEVDREMGGVRTKDIFHLDEEDEDGQLLPTGCLPTFMEQLIENNLLDLHDFYLEEGTVGRKAHAGGGH
jgi:Flp pilus assembly CpaF family ATPase